MQAARQKAVSKVSALEWEHNVLEAMVDQKPAPSAEASDGSDPRQDNASTLARLRGLSDQRKTLMELDRRIQDCQQIAETYQSWIGLLDARRAGVLHLLLGSLGLVLGILLCVVAAETGVRHAFRDQPDRHRMPPGALLGRAGGAPGGGPRDSADLVRAAEPDADHHRPGDGGADRWP